MVKEGSVHTFYALLPAPYAPTKGHNIFTYPLTLLYKALQLPQQDIIADIYPRSAAARFTNDYRVRLLMFVSRPWPFWGCYVRRPTELNESQKEF